MATTRVTQTLEAPRSRVYRALLDPQAVARWMVPDGMRSEVHVFEPRVGGFFRITLTYDASGGSGKTTAHSDTHHGYFVELVPDTKVVQRVEFETSAPSLQGQMRITFTLEDLEGGKTLLTGVHENLPPGVPPEDNTLGWRMSLQKLARLVESGG